MEYASSPVAQPALHAWIEVRPASSTSGRNRVASQRKCSG